MSACIWYVSKYATLPSDKTGARSFRLMREMARFGHRPVMFASDSNHLFDAPKVEGSHLRTVVDDVEVCWIRTRKYRGAKSLGRVLSWLDFEWRLWKLPKQGFPRPDVVIASSLSLLSIFNGLAMRRRYNCKLVFEVRDIWPLTIVEEGGFSPRNPLVMALRWIEKMAYRRADLIVGTMPNLTQHIEASIGDRHPPVHYIPFGIDADATKPARPLAKEWADRYLPKDRFIVGYAGTIGITNALDVLIECARSMQDRPDIHFMVVGEGDLRPRYELECADLANVTFTGPVPKELVQSVLAECDLLYFSVHPSKVWKFGLSLNKVIDYMLAGKPILASYSGYSTMVDEALSGVSVPAGDAVALRAEIVRLAGTPAAELRAMGARGRAWLLEHRDYATLARDYLQLIAPEHFVPEVADKDHVHAV